MGQGLCLLCHCLIVKESEEALDGITQFLRLDIKDKPTETFMMFEYSTLLRIIIIIIIIIVVHKLCTLLLHIGSLFGWSKMGQR